MLKNRCIIKIKMIYLGNEKKLFTNQTKTFVFMKKFNYLFGWLFCGAALLGFGCDDDKTDVSPPPDGYV